MSNHSVTAFDCIRGATKPFSGFGSIEADSLELFSKLQRLSEDAKQRLRQGFSREFDDPTTVGSTLDDIVKEMWTNGWTPERGNVNLFTTDFGLVLTTAIFELAGGQPVFRAISDLNHFSLYWPKAPAEAFPFHKVLKCLYHREGESMAQFVTGILQFTGMEGHA